MALRLQPLVIGGFGLAASIWLLDGVTDWLGEWVPAIVIGSGLAWVYLKASGSSSAKLTYRKPVTIEAIKTAIVEVETVVNQFAAEVQDLAIAGSAQEISALRSQLHDILTELKREDLRLAIVGGKGVGKTSLTEWLQAQWAKDVSQQLQLQDTPALFSAAKDGLSAEAETWEVAKSADLVMFVTDGDLTATQLQAIQTLVRSYRRTLIVLNKQDQYLPKEQEEILTKIRDRVKAVIPPEDVLGIATQPRPMKVRQHQADGSIKEWLEEPDPQVETLTARLQTILATESQKLILASSLGNAEALKVEAKSKLNQVRRDRAMPVLDRAQWVVAGTAFANPFPALDLLATAAINTQMVIDLSNLYRQSFSLDQAKTIAKTMAELMIKLGIVEISTQAIGALLKTNAVTYVAGGALQGVSAAYLTRIAGLTLIEYFEAESASQTVKTDRLQTILKTVFQTNQRSAFLQQFVRQAIEQIMPEKGSQGSREMQVAELPLVNEMMRSEATIALPAAQAQVLEARPRLNLPDVVQVEERSEDSEADLNLEADPTLEMMSR